MSLATRCPHCKTVFQVNEEQLKFRSGTVRCGVCHCLFNGIDNLVGRIAPKEAESRSKHRENSREPETKPMSTTSSNNQSATVNDHIHSETENPPYPENTADKVLPLSDDALKEAFDKQLQTISLELNDFPASKNQTASGSPIFSVPEDLSPRKDFSLEDKNTQSSTNPGHILTDEKLAVVIRKEEDVSGENAESLQALSQSDQKHGTENILLPSEAKSDELIKTIQQKRKKSRLSQVFWSIGVILLVLLLGGQILYLYSERIVLWWPPAKNLVDSACEILTCPASIPPESSSSLHMEYGELSAKEGFPGQFTQKITMTNDSPSQQLFPTLVMEISDTEGHLLSRRFLEPEEYLSEKSRIANGLAPSEETSFQLDFEYQHDAAINSRVIFLNH